tara:strand:- start:492 stop:1142 length:651 start_codon:yes stop_codon:yes gene_type:complete
MSSFKNWKIESKDLIGINDMANEDMNQVFNNLYQVYDNQFLQEWCKDSIMYECLGARTNMNIASSRSDQAKKALNVAKDNRVDTHTEIGMNQEYDRDVTYIGWADYADYWTNKYDVWSTKFEETYGETWEVALEATKKSRSSGSELRVANQEEIDDYADKLRNADVRRLVDLPSTSPTNVAKRQTEKVKAMKEYNAIMATKDSDDPMDEENDRVWS